MTRGRDIGVRAAHAGDADAVSALLALSYPRLLAPFYAPDLLSRALPYMIHANAALLGSNTYYVATLPDAADAIIGCGGWTSWRPGAPGDAIDPTLGHVRHFATHPDWTGRGIGRAMFDRCVHDARAAGVRRFECYATLAAEDFYRALGFEAAERFDVAMGAVAFPGIRMFYRLVPYSELSYHCVQRFLARHHSTTMRKRDILHALRRGVAGCPATSKAP